MLMKCCILFKGVNMEIININSLPKKSVVQNSSNPDSEKVLTDREKAEFVRDNALSKLAVDTVNISGEAIMLYNGGGHPQRPPV
jgi:hypothetical protein